MLTFIGSLLDLLVVGGLLQEVEDGTSQLGVSQRVGFGVHCFRF